MEIAKSWLKKIRTWDASDLDGLIEYVRNIWEYADCGYFEKQENGLYRLSTAGWCDNEEIIAAMQRNTMWWMVNWFSSRRGGHYEFGREVENEQPK
jgi:hypothetical protein